MNIGKNIANIRKEQHLSQEQFGNLFHLTRQTISNYENEKSYPDLQLLIEISEHFKVSLDQLLKEDTSMIKKIDTERKFAKRSLIIICILLALVVSLGIGIKIVSDAWKPTSAMKRNISYTTSVMYLNFPDATPSRAIIRTYTQDDYDAFSAKQISKMRDEIGGSIEGDIPVLDLEKGSIIRPVFQDDIGINVTPDTVPQVIVKEYNNVSVLPIKDSDSPDEPKNLSLRFQSDEAGYYLDFSKYKESDEDFRTCFIEIRYEINREKYVGVSAFHLL